MKKCPRCDLLLLDTDAECVRCHAPVDVTMSSEEAREKHVKEIEAWRRKQARSRPDDPDYLPPWLPPSSLPVAGLLKGFFWAFALYRASREFDVQFLVKSAIFWMGFILVVTIALFFALWIIEAKRPGIDRSLLTASLMVLLPGFANFLFLLFIPSFPFTGSVVLTAGMLYLVLQGLYEMSIGRVGVVIAICGAILVAAAYYGAPILLGDLLQNAKEARFF